MWYVCVYVAGGEFHLGFPTVMTLLHTLGRQCESSANREV